MSTATHERPSLESLIESLDLGIEVLHPGGLETTRALVELCHPTRDSAILDVASGTGETACFLAETFGCQVAGVDAAEAMVARGREKASKRNLAVEFRQGDAHHLGFDDNSFDVVISECTLCFLHKDAALAEMIRVARPGGYVGIHDLCWKEGASDRLKQELAELESEYPETLAGWTQLFERAGLVDVAGVDKSPLMRDWTRQVKRQLGLRGQLVIFAGIIKRWGLGGLRKILRSEKVFRSDQLGYGLIVGRKA